jgi:hypothetical protein
MRRRELELPLTTRDGEDRALASGCSWAPERHAEAGVWENFAAQQGLGPAVDDAWQAQRFRTTEVPRTAVERAETRAPP